MPNTPSLQPPARRYTIDATVFDAEQLRPGLYVTATPIGNLGDITIRALAVLAAADLILCEDTRVTVRLLHRYDIAAKLKPYHDHNAAKLRPRYLAALREGAALALVSDAGTPLVSDPGYKLVEAALAEGFHVEAIPGPSALLAALALSGLPSDRFMFCGFLPHKASERRAALDGLRSLAATLIFFESPNRIIETLQAVHEVLGERAIAVTRELTKIHEEAVRGDVLAVLRALQARAAIKGEITLVIGPPAHGPVPSQAEIDAQLVEAAKALPASQAAALVARASGLPRQDVYARLLALKSHDRG